MTVPTFINLGASQPSSPADPDINFAADATSYTGNSFIPPTSGLAVAFVGSRVNGGDPVQPTVTGWGLTWTFIDSVLNSDGIKIQLFAADLTGATEGAITVDFGAETQQACSVSLSYIDDADLSGGVSGAFVQTPSATGSGTSASVTLAAAGHADNRPIACALVRANEDVAPRTNWTELDNITGAGPTRSLETQYRDDAFETTASASWTTSAAWAILAVEIKGASSGGSTTTLTADHGSFAHNGQAASFQVAVSVEHGSFS